MFGGTPGSAGLVRAIVFGLGAGAASALLYYVVLRLSGYHIGLLAIAVGWLVGQGVRVGSGGRGGALYQALALVITYLAIVTSYVPMVLEGAGASGGGISLIAVAILALAAPVLLLFQGQFSIVIIALGLYEAWRLNKRVRLTVTGPFHRGFARSSRFPSQGAGPGLPPT
jgi:hypothetical protein